MLSLFTRFVAVVVLTATSFVASPDNSFAQSTDEVLRRLEAKLDALARENVALRKRVRQIESPRQAAVKPATAPEPAAKPPGYSDYAAATSSNRVATAPSAGAARRTFAASATSNWTGFYVGGSAGYGWGDPTTATSNNNPRTAFNTSVFVPLNPAQYTTKNNGWIAGVQAGYNYQITRSVLGIESDFNWTNINGVTENSAVCSGFTGGFPNCTYSQSQKLDWFATIRGRLGFVLVPETMIYGTGGFAFGHATVSHSLFSTGFAGTFNATATTSNTKTGWVIGAGIESMIMPNWTVRLEYLHYDLGTVSSVAPILNPGPTGTTTQANFRVNGDLARVGLIYKFY